MKKIKLKTLIESLVREELKTANSAVHLVAAIEDMYYKRDVPNAMELAELLKDVLENDHLRSDALERIETFIEEHDEFMGKDLESDDSDPVSDKEFGVGRDSDRATGVRSPR